MPSPERATVFRPLRGLAFAGAIGSRGSRPWLFTDALPGLCHRPSHAKRTRVNQHPPQQGRSYCMPLTCYPRRRKCPRTLAIAPIQTVVALSHRPSTGEQPGRVRDRHDISTPGRRSHPQACVFLSLLLRIRTREYHSQAQEAKSLQLPVKALPPVPELNQVFDNETIDAKRLMRAGPMVTIATIKPIIPCFRRGSGYDGT